MAQTKARGGKRAAKPKRQKKNGALDVSAPDKEAELRALTRALELAQGFKLIFVRCNQPAQRKRLTEKLRERLPKLLIEEVEFKTEIRHLLDELRHRFDEPPQGAVFVAGLEYSMPKSETAHATSMVANLNAARNSFPVHVPCPLVLWLPEYALTAIQRGAPDFFSVRSGAYHFAATPPDTASLQQSLVAGEEWAVANLPLEEKEERIASIQSLLADYRSLPAPQRDRPAEARLLGHLGSILNSLGRWTEAEAAHQQSQAICREFGNRLGEGMTLTNLGNVYRSQGKWAEAEAAYEQSLTIKREFGDRVGEGRTLGNLAQMRRAQGDFDVALEYAKQALAVWETTEDNAELDKARTVVAKLEEEIRRRQTLSRLSNRGEDVIAELVIIVFTDIVNSTAIKSLLPGGDIRARNQEYIDRILKPHRAKVDAAWKAHGGRVVKTEGDAYFLVFADATSAARCAVDIQRSHAQDPIDTGTTRGALRVKIGMHTGAPLADPDDPNDYSGLEVDYAARVGALANAGQIVVSDVTAGLVRDAQIDDCKLHPHGERNLKGIGPVPIYELLHSDHPGPQALKEAALSPCNIPLPPQTFVGRDDEMTDLRERIARGGVTILKGEGGIGKSALAQVVAMMAHNAGELPGGAVWVSCEQSKTYEECLREIACGLFEDRLEKRALEECNARVMAHLREHHGLILLDNFETAASDVALLRWIALVRSPVSVLLTTREVMEGLHGQVVELHELPRDKAKEMFISIAKDKGAKQLDDRIVDEFCKLAGDLPLAIELLAPQAADLPLTALRARLIKSLDVIADEDPLRKPQQKSIEACFGVSFDRLSRDAQNLLMRLSLLTDGASEYVIAGFTEIALWHMPIQTSVRHSLLRFDGVKYRFHPLEQRFAQNHLGNALEQWQRRMVEFYVKFVEENKDINNAQKRAALDAEWRNAITAAEVAEVIPSRDSDGAVHLLVCAISEGLSDFLDLRGLWSERERLCVRALDAARRAGDRAAEGRALGNLGIVYKLQGKLAEAEAAHQQSLAIFREVGDRLSEGKALGNLGIVYKLQGKLAEAEAAYQQCLTIFREAGDRVGEGKTLNNLGEAYRLQGKLAEAEAAYQQSLAIFREVGDRVGEGRTLNNLGIVYELQGKWVEAEASYQQGLTIKREVGDRVGEGTTLYNLSALKESQNELAGALEFAMQSVEVLEKTEAMAELDNARAQVAKLEEEIRRR